MSKLLNTLLSVLVCSSAVRAGPSTPSMAAKAVDASPRSEISPAAVITGDVQAERPADDRPMALADAIDLAPTDSHPMIPVPPALWAGFVGLAYVARRVTRRNAI